MYEIMIETHFSAAHAVRGYKGKCENTHGHNFKIEVYARGEQLDSIGMLYDFKDLKAATKEIIDRLDHTFINEVPPFDKELNTTAELLAYWICTEVRNLIKSEFAEVYKVRVWEAPSYAATYQIPDSK